MDRKPTRKWWRAYGELYGKQIELGEGQSRGLEEKTRSAPKKAVKRDCPNEQQEQFVAIAWCHRNNIVVHHSPNGGYRDVREAAKFKRLGTSAGFPDLILPYMRKGYGGLYIELKRVYGGKLSEHQEWWRDHLIKEGYAWYEAKGAEECIKIIRDYLSC